jgi:putative flippase GtrA
MANEASHQQVLRFIIVGSAAAAVHFLVVLVLVQGLHWLPLLANIAAFVVAFQVSYCGHHFWTFAHDTRSHQQSLPRFLLVAIGSFCLNEFLYFLLLHYAPFPYWLSLGMVLVSVAVITFLLGKFWAFAS